MVLLYHKRFALSLFLFCELFGVHFTLILSFLSYYKKIRDHGYAEDDAVPAENLEIVLFHE